MSTEIITNNLEEAMENTTEKFDNKFVPTTYEELYLHYFVGKNGSSLAKMLVRQFMPFAGKEEAEDLEAAAFLRLKDFDILTKFDPKKANFGGTIYFAIRSVCANHLAKKSRDPISGLCAGSLVEVSEEGEEFVKGSYRMDAIEAEYGAINEEAIDAKDQVSKLMSKLEIREKKGATVRDRGLKKLAELLMEGYDVKEAAEILEVGTSTIHNWLKCLRETALDLAR